ncbi:hypothetical protein Lal_00012643 [Lupinus albus]|nr:hypothetical protein Lal_00012643 [Lupinus albus]
MDEQISKNKKITTKCVHRSHLNNFNLIENMKMSKKIRMTMKVKMSKKVKREKKVMSYKKKRETKCLEAHARSLEDRIKSFSMNMGCQLDQIKELLLNLAISWE